MADGFVIEEMFEAGDARILMGDGVTTVTMPTLTAIEAYIADPVAGAIAGLVSLGDTKIDETIQFEEDAATYENRGTLQHRVLKETLTQAAVSRFTLNSMQPRKGRIMELYYGGGTEGDGYFDAPAAADSKPIEVPCLIIFKDGLDVFPAFMPRVSVRRNGPITFPMDQFAEVPLAGTILEPETGTSTRWYSETFTAPVGG
ncbi:hypothetical protein [Cumulibacter soli]|uniref:phage tail tube protein n=1 Tax=Cumulibacter soli TaxID=2546344 RepID=UPI001068A256|nr:hypothetical protein [Cumulibacter soli]